MFLNVNHYKSIITWDSSLANIYLISKSNLRTLRLLLFSCHAISSEERLLRLVSEELFCKIITLVTVAVALVTKSVIPRV